LASEVLYAALNMLTEKQKERIIKYYLQGLTLEKIAEDEGVYYKAISFSIESGLKKLKKLLENDY
jgi:RNA polymerase sigma-70 factor (ECF subfamily)